MAKSNMVDRIKDRINQSGRGLGNFFFVPEGEKAKVRFISDFDKAIPITEHDKYGDLSPTPCLKKHFGKECPFCKVSKVRTREVYAWTVFDYGSKEKKVMKYAANQFTPVLQLVSMYENYGNLTDRDYVISRQGKGTSVSYGVVPLDKAKFNKKLRPFTEEEIIEKCIDASDEINMDEIDELDGTEELDDDEEYEEEYEEDGDDEYTDEDDYAEETDDEDDDDEFELDDDDEPFDEDDDEEEDEAPKTKKKKK